MNLPQKEIDVLISEVGMRDGLQSIPTSASVVHSLANLRKTREEMIEEVRCIVDYKNEVAPHAPGASGNLVTEDLAFMFEDMGVRTGIDLEKLIAARQPMMDGLPGEAVYGMLAPAGLTKGFTYAK